MKIKWMITALMVATLLRAKTSLYALEETRQRGDEGDNILENLRAAQEIHQLTRFGDTPLFISSHDLHLQAVYDLLITFYQNKSETSSKPLEFQENTPHFLGGNIFKKSIQSIFQYCCCCPKRGAQN